MANYKTQKSEDGTIRISFDEGYSAVIIPSKDEKFAICVSCQIGCPVGCTFCRSGKIKFKRNLTAEEIFNQAEVASEIIGRSPSSIIFMGIGEPTLNLDNVSNAAEMMHKRFNMSYNHITISTSCLNTLNKLVDSKFNLALSLHSPFDKIRKKIMPLGCSVVKIMKFANDYVKNANNKKYIMIEYSLIKGINDSDKDLKKLASLKWPKRTLFNLIEFNEIDNLKASDFATLLKFKDVLMKKGWKCFIRNSRGKDIGASCGMLSLD